VITVASSPEERAFVKGKIEELRKELSQAKEELQARTRELTEALEQKTAMGEILRVISNSPTKLEQALDALVKSAAKFCGAEDVSIHRLEGDHLVAVAHCGAIPAIMTPVVRGTVLGRCMLERRTVHVEDLQAETEAYPEGSAMARKLGHRTMLGVPLLWGGLPLGAFRLRRGKVEPFSDKQIVLLETFAEHAVIAIENTRLFEEVRARNRDLAALSEVGRAVSSTLDLKVVLKIIVARAVSLSGTDGGAIFYYREEGGTFELGETVGLDTKLVTKLRRLDISAMETGLGEAIANRLPLQIPDMAERPSNPLRDAALGAGLRAALIVPLLGAEGPRGTLVLQRRKPGDFPRATIDLMQSFADQSATALENARLFGEIARTRREQLQQAQAELAHVTRVTTLGELTASIAHEVNQPLAAIITNGETSLRFLGRDPPRIDKVRDALSSMIGDGKRASEIVQRVRALAKKSEPQMARLTVNTLVKETITLVRREIAKHSVALRLEFAPGLPEVLGDRVQLQQVIINLMINSIQAMDAIDDRSRELVIHTRLDELGRALVSVQDSGAGIDPANATRLFDPFFTTKPNGMGMGLSICRTIIEAHGGRLWASGNAGPGATFQFSLPAISELAP
jgi:signal transduction histidine kinase